MPELTSSLETKLRRSLNYSKYWGSVDLKHVDFNVKATEYKVFRLQDYSWEEHGFSMLNRYYPGAGELMDKVFTETLTMTEYTLFGNKDVDTEPFRQAIWYYVLRLNGMSHDDYSHQQVDVHLFRVEQLHAQPRVVFSRDRLGNARDLLDIGLERHAQHRVDLER